MFYKIIFTSLVLMFFNSSVSANIYTDIKLGDLKIKYVTYPVGNKEYSLDVAISEKAKTLEEILEENNAITGINGVFFCPEDYKECGGKNYTINERFVDGQDLSFYDNTGERGVFAWNHKGIPFLFRSQYINPDNRGEIYEGMGNFPVLLSSGKNQITYYDAIGLLDAKMKYPLPRHFICSNEKKTEIFFGETSAVSLEKLAEKLPDIGCYDALNLDAGQSSYFTYNGKNITQGNRKVIDAFVISSPKISVTDTGKKTDILIEKLLGNYTQESRVKTLKKIKYYITVLKSARNRLYHKYSKDLHSSEGEYIGYTTDIYNSTDVEKIYLINILEKKLNKISKEIRQK